MSHVVPGCLGRGIFGAARDLAIEGQVFPLQVCSPHALKHLARLGGLLRGRHPKGQISALASGPGVVGTERICPHRGENINEIPMILRAPMLKKR